MKPATSLLEGSPADSNVKTTAPEAEGGVHRQHRALVAWRRSFQIGLGTELAPVVPPRKEWRHPLTRDPRPRQSIQPTANLDRTDDMVYLNVMELVRAVLDLKNELCQLPPEAYVVVVKVSARGRTRAGEVEAVHPSPASTWGGAELPGPPNVLASFPGRPLLEQRGQRAFSPR